jgi:hypothetical protein
LPTPAAVEPPITATAMSLRAGPVTLGGGTSGAVPIRSARFETPASLSRADATVSPAAAVVTPMASRALRTTGQTRCGAERTCARGPRTMAPTAIMMR